MQPIIITKANGEKEIFDKDKLFHSLSNAGGAESVVRNIVDHISKEIREGMSTSEIYSHAFKLLREHSVPIAVKYSLRRAIGELGPDGFPFEKFVARVFNNWGYEALTDQAVMGSCVEHEIDVVAWKGNDLAMVEAKFHNEFGLKSDLKVVLYVKARYDDIEGKIFNYGGKEMRLTEKFIFTNTKFTDKAITYAKCSGLKLIGWNYPSRGNLHDIITDNRLQPITSLSTLSNQEKKELIQRGFILCSDIVDTSSVLNEIKPKEEIGKIIYEAKSVMSSGK